MLLNLSDLSSETLQDQIIRQIRAKILAGELPADMDLPSIRSLARDNRVSVITVQRAYEALVNERLIHSRRGKGFFVSGLADQAKTQLATDRLREQIRPLIQHARAEGLENDLIWQTIQEVISDS